jgi:hypothetical protein
MMEFGNTVVPAGSEVSIAYPVRPDPSLEPREFQIAATIWYEDSDQRLYSSTFFNSTVELVEAESAFDSSLLFGAVAVLAIAGLIGFGAYRAVLGRGMKVSNPLSGSGDAYSAQLSRKIETGTKDAAAHDFISDILPKRSRTPKRVTPAKTEKAE